MSGALLHRGLNACIRAASGELIVRMDCHSRYASDYVRRCVEAAEETGAWNVGGIYEPEGVTRTERAVACALSSPFGGVNWTKRSAGVRSEVDTVYLGAFLPIAFERAGLYDETFVRNQDDELNLRIRRAGGRIVFDPAIRPVPTTVFLPGSLAPVSRVRVLEGCGDAQAPAGCQRSLASTRRLRYGPRGPWRGGATVPGISTPAGRQYGAVRSGCSSGGGCRDATPRRGSGRPRRAWPPCSRAFISGTASECSTVSCTQLSAGVRPPTRLAGRAHRSSAFASQMDVVRTLRVTRRPGGRSRGGRRRCSAPLRRTAGGTPAGRAPRAPGTSAGRCRLPARSRGPVTR